ncbi:ACP S-malonyltransferase [bacterium]
MTRTAFIFPGQGSQYVGMGKDLAEKFSQAKEIYAKANDILGYDLSAISFLGPEETLTQTQYTQPALYTHSLIVAELLKENGILAEAVAGHSLGEFSALGYAGAYDFEVGLKLVHERGTLMQSAGKAVKGAMAAIIGLDADVVINLCKEAESVGIVQAANFNSPAQIVISGSSEGVDKAMELAKNAGAKRTLKLPVSGAFHSPLMNSAANLFQDILGNIQFNDLSIPVFANVTAQAYTSVDEIGQLLCKQLTHSVRWIETIENMIQNGISRFIEVGPNKVLAGLVKRINRDIEVISLGSVETIESIQS